MYQIRSINSYKNSILKIDLNPQNLLKKKQIHEDYEFIKDFIENKIKKADRIVFFGVFDLSKEAYFLNKFPEKKFVLCDISIVFLKKIEKIFHNIEIIKTSIQDFIPEKNDLLITNLSEYFLDKNELIDFTSFGKNIILNNVSIIEKDFFYEFYDIMKKLKIHTVNFLSVFFNLKPYQFRGWIRSINDYNLIANAANKKLSVYIFNKKREVKYRFFKMKYAMISYETKNNPLT